MLNRQSALALALVLTTCGRGHAQDEDVRRFASSPVQIQQLSLIRITRQP
jgi:hypothetical protein